MKNVGDNLKISRVTLGFFEALTIYKGHYREDLLNCGLRAYKDPWKCWARVFEVPTRKAKVHVKQSAILQSGFLIFQIAVVKLSGRGAVLGKGKEESAGSGVVHTLHDMLPYAPRESAVKICDISLFMWWAPFFSRNSTQPARNSLGNQCEIGEEIAFSIVGKG